jgi:ABC-type glycerol-3-phosphate transport system substrate-binding protein
MRARLRLAALVAAGLLVLSGCGSNQDEGSNASPTVTTTASAAATSTATVSANDASVQELQAAFEAAGIANAGRWAREVAEYRPYPTDDPTFAKLRGELAKYNPAPGVVDQIVSVLEL